MFNKEDWKYITKFEDLADCSRKIRANYSRSCGNRFFYDNVREVCGCIVESGRNEFIWLPRNDFNEYYLISGKYNFCP